MEVPQYFLQSPLQEPYAESIQNPAHIRRKLAFEIPGTKKEGGSLLATQKHPNINCWDGRPLPSETEPRSTTIS